jgi:hypothetical protein
MLRASGASPKKNRATLGAIYVVKDLTTRRRVLDLVKAGVRACMECVWMGTGIISCRGCVHECAGVRVWLDEFSCMM